MKKTIAFVVLASLLTALACSTHDGAPPAARSEPAGNASTTATPATTPSLAGVPASLSKLTPNELKWGISPTRNSQVTYQPDVIIMEHGSDAVRAMASNGLTWTINANAPHASEIKVDKILFATGRVVGTRAEGRRHTQRSRGDTRTGRDHGGHQGLQPEVGPASRLLQRGRLHSPGLSRRNDRGQADDSNGSRNAARARVVRIVQSSRTGCAGRASGCGSDVRSTRANGDRQLHGHPGLLRRIGNHDRAPGIGRDHAGVGDRSAPSAARRLCARHPEWDHLHRAGAAQRHGGFSRELPGTNGCRCDRQHQEKLLCSCRQFLPVARPRGSALCGDTSDPARGNDILGADRNARGHWRIRFHGRFQSRP